MRTRLFYSASPPIAAVAMLVAIVVAAPFVVAQTASTRYMGTITTIAGNTLTVKTDSGDVHQVEVPAGASLKRIAPGERDLSKAETIDLSALATGDRVLVKLDPNATGAMPQAAQVIAIKQADMAMKRQKDNEDWQRNGVGGLVKSVDQGSGVVLLTVGAGPTAKTATVHISKTTVLKRYADGSVRFDQAQPAPIDTIHAGDQLLARGVKSADGTDVTAQEVVSGSFRNISGTILSIDAANSALTVKDLITKKPVTIHISPDAQMRRLPDMMARMIAARLKGSAPAPGAPSPAAGATPPQSGAAPSGSAQGNGRGQWAGQNRGSGTGDMQQVLSRAPAIHVGDLQKGEAVMVVSSQGATDVTAITLIAGVEPLLEAPAASQDLLSNWSMNSGGGAADSAQ